MSAEAKVRRTKGSLADGRQILYFDDSEPFVSGGASRDTPDCGRSAKHREQESAASTR